MEHGLAVYRDTQLPVGDLSVPHLQMEHMAESRSNVVSDVLLRAMWRNKTNQVNWDDSNIFPMSGPNLRADHLL